VLGPIAKRIIVPGATPDVTAKPAAKTPGMQGDTAPPSFWSGMVAERPTRWTPDDVRVGPGAGATSAFSVMEQVRTSVDRREDFAPGTKVTLEVHPKSVVGSLITVQWKCSYSAPGAAHPDAEGGFMTIDLARPTKPAKLDDYFSSDSVLVNLLADPLIKQALAGRGVKTPPSSLTELAKTLDGATGTFKGQAYSFGGDWLAHFAIHHSAQGKAFVRIALPSDSEQDRGGLGQIGLALPIPQALAPALEKARKDHTFMTDFERVKTEHGARTSYITPDKQAP
jgi:hypothetical protein